MSRPNAKNDLCSRTERWFSERGRTRIPSALRQHLLRCTECRAEYSDGLPLSRLVDLPSLHEPRAYGPESLDRRRFRDAVMSAVELERSGVVRRTETRVWRVAALVLVSTLLFAAGYRFLGRGPDNSSASGGSSAVSQVEVRSAIEAEPARGAGLQRFDRERGTVRTDPAALVERPPFLVGVEPIEPTTPYPVVDVAGDEQGEVVTF